MASTLTVPPIPLHSLSHTCAHTHTHAHTTLIQPTQYACYLYVLFSGMNKCYLIINWGRSVFPGKVYYSRLPLAAWNSSSRVEAPTSFPSAIISGLLVSCLFESCVGSHVDETSPIKSRQLVFLKGNRCLSPPKTWHKTGELKILQRPAQQDS